MDDTRALAAFAALSNGDRLAIVRRLVRAGDQGVPASELANAVGASPSRTSFHLSALSETGLIVAEKRSRQMIYRVSFETMGHLAGFLLTDCCADNPVARSCCQ
ncbi:MAG: metalloregulator ArsR/SmtB family transcription factor [Pseudomonadota bacterium]